MSYSMTKFKVLSLNAVKVLSLIRHEVLSLNRFRALSLNSFKNNLNVLSLNKFRDLFFFKLKSYLSLSVLLAFFLSFSLTGCNWQGTANGGGSSVNNEPPVFSVSFYDENLSFLEKQNVAEGIINPSNIITGTWYKAGENNPVTSHNLVSNITFYAVANVIEITDQTELDNIRNNLGGKYILLNDIDLNATADGFDASYGWIPIGGIYPNSFTGIFSGNGNKITNLWINRTSTDYVGLFGIIQNSQIKNLTVEATEVKGQQYVGIIAGHITSSTITNSHSTANVSGTSYYVGGIAGYVRYSTITNSYSTGNINGSSYVGGIAGYVQSYSSITNSYSTGNVSGIGDSVGGIAGALSQSTITNSHSTANVSGTSYYVGGIAGYVSSSSSITNSYSTANVSGTSNYVGGIAGYVWSSSIANSYSTGTISGTDQVGGIAGYVYYSSTVTNNAAINPSVTGTSDVNRIAGYIDGSTVTNNFARSVLNSGFSDFSDGNTNSGTGKADDDFLLKITYETGLGWDFVDTWKIDEGNGYPYLYWQD